jgi:hypothetical protein
VPGLRRRTMPTCALVRTDLPATSITIGSKRARRRSRSTSL